MKKWAGPGIVWRLVLSSMASAVLIGLLTLTVTAAAQDNGEPEVELTVRAGYDGYYKNDLWVPVHVSAANVGPAIEGYLQVVTGSSGSNDRVVYRSPISLPTSSNKGQTLYIHVSSFANELEVELVDGSDRVIASEQTGRLSSLGDDSLLYGVVTRDPGRLEFLEDVTGGRSEAAVAYLSLEEMPDVAAALNALDVIVFHDVDSGQLTSRQRQALESWLDTGGQLVVTGGPSWQETAAGLVDLLPVTISGAQTLDDIPALREFAALPFRDQGPYLVTEGQLQSGETLIHQDGTPLLARQSHGRGSIFFLALDPSLAPLLDWQGGKTVWTEIASYAQPLPEWANGARQSYAAASAVSSLPASDLPSAWTLFFFLMFYVIVVGPVNYLILRRLGRKELAWLTIPLLVIFFSTTAYVVGFRLKGNDTIINQMSIIYGQVEADNGRVQTLIGLYSPRRASYDLVLPTEAIPRPFDRSSGTMGGQGNVEAVERAESVVVSDIQVDVGGVETLVADSYQPMPEVSGEVRISASASDVTLDIELFNNGSTVLENATLLVGSAAIPLGDLAPGSSVSRREKITSLTGTPTASGPSSFYAPSPPTSSPLLANMDTILGSTNFYNDRDVFPRWQLLQAMAPDYGPSARAYAPDAFTLVAWSDRPQLDLSLREQEYSVSATSLYFLEVPVNQDAFGAAEIVVPRHLLNWTVLAEVGVYDARVDDLFLPEGNVEFEFSPWSDFQSMQVQDIAVVVQPPSGAPGQRPPRVRLWDWAVEEWRTATDPGWGRLRVEDATRYVGPANAVRIQLSNLGPEGITVQHIYPELIGIVE